MGARHTCIFMCTCGHISASVIDSVYAVRVGQTLGRVYGKLHESCSDIVCVCLTGDPLTFYILGLKVKQKNKKNKKSNPNI